MKSLAPDWQPLQQLNEIKPLHPLIHEVAQGSFRLKQPPEIQGSGWVVKSLEASLWAFHDADSFEEAVLKAVNLGDDADTTGAICGNAGHFGANLEFPNRSERVSHEWICWRTPWRALWVTKDRYENPLPPRLAFGPWRRQTDLLEGPRSRSHQPRPR